MRLISKLRALTCSYCEIFREFFNVSHLPIGRVRHYTVFTHHGWYINAHILYVSRKKKKPLFRLRGHMYALELGFVKV